MLNYETSHPRAIKDLPKSEPYFMILTEKTTCVSTGYEKPGEQGDMVQSLNIHVVFSEKELEEFAKEQTTNHSYNKKVFTFVKCLPMSYNISIETKVSVSV